MHVITLGGRVANRRWHERADFNHMVVVIGV